MDKEILTKYAPIVLVIFTIFFQYNLFVTPQELEKQHREILEEVSEKYMTYLNEYVKKNKDNNLYESLLKVIDLDVEKKIPAEILDEEQWYEINDIQDMDIAESMFADGNEKVRKYLQRYGGYSTNAPSRSSSTGPRRWYDDKTYTGPHRGGPR